MFNISLAQTLRKLRDDSGLLQREFAAQFDITQRRWSKIESGESRLSEIEMEMVHAKYGELPGVIHPRGALRTLSENAKGHRSPPSLY